MNISVAMAVYNGEKYIKEQLDSILKQLDESDELIISYNESDDKSFDILGEYASKYNNVKVYQHKEKGIISNFNNAIMHCNNDFIFLSDQDDIWREDKVSKVMEAFNSDPTILTVMHNCEYVDEDLKPLNKNLFKERKVKQGFFKNLIKNGYQGSCMAFRSDLMPFITPIPTTLAMHDQWIGLMSERAGHIKFLTEPLMQYRIHPDSHTTAHVPPLKKIKWMCKMTYHILEANNEKKMLRWYLQSIYAPEKKADFDFDGTGPTLEEQQAKINEMNGNGETMMYMVQDLKDEEKKDGKD